MQVSGPAAQQLKVLRAGHLREVEPGGGLLQCQRQPPELLRDLPRRVLIQVRHPSPQYPHRVRQIDHVKVQHGPHRGKPAPAGRHDRMPGNACRQRPARQPQLDILYPVGVIEDQQPSGHGPKPVMNQHPKRLRVSGRLQAQPGRQRGELVRDRGGFLGSHPPHQVIRGSAGVGVLDGQLGLANPAHPMHRMHRHRPADSQCTLQSLQFLVPAGEIWVARRDLPHLRQHAREPGRARHSPSRARKRRRLSRLGPAGDCRRYHFLQPGLCRQLGQPAQVHPDHLVEQGRPVAGRHPDRQQPTVGALRVADPRSPPLSPAIYRSQVIR